MTNNNPFYGQDALIQNEEYKNDGFIPSAPPFQSNLYDKNHEKKLINNLVDIVFKFDESKWKNDEMDKKEDIITHHKMISNTQYCIRGVSRFKYQNIMNFYDYLYSGNHQKSLGWMDQNHYEDMRKIDDDHVFIYHKPTFQSFLSKIVSPRDFCVIRTRFKMENYTFNYQEFDICGSLSYSVDSDHPWHQKLNKKYIRCNINYHSFLLIHNKDQMVSKNANKLYFISNVDVKGSMPKWLVDCTVSYQFLNENINAYQNLKQFSESWNDKMKIIMKSDKKHWSECLIKNDGVNI